MSQEQEQIAETLHVVHEHECSAQCDHYHAHEHIDLHEEHEHSDSCGHLHHDEVVSHVDHTHEHVHDHACGHLDFEEATTNHVDRSNDDQQQQRQWLRLQRQQVDTITETMVMQPIQRPILEQADPMQAAVVLKPVIKILKEKQLIPEEQVYNDIETVAPMVDEISKPILEVMQQPLPPVDLVVFKIPKAEAVTEPVVTVNKRADMNVQPFKPIIEDKPNVPAIVQQHIELPFVKTDASVPTLYQEVEPLDDIYEIPILSERVLVDNATLITIEDIIPTTEHVQLETTQLTEELTEVITELTEITLQNVVSENTHRALRIIDEKLPKMNQVEVEEIVKLFSDLPMETLAILPERLRELVTAGKQRELNFYSALHAVSTTDTTLAIAQAVMSLLQLKRLLT